VKIIDKYILFRFLKIIAVSLLSFILIVVIVDVIENVDKFIDHHAPLDAIVMYYICYMPFIIMLALPVAVLLSTMFTIGSMARYHELEIMKATGLSLYRLSRPLLIAGFIISLIAIVFTEFVMVPADYQKDIIKKEQIEKRAPVDKRLIQNVIKAGRDGWIVYARTYNEREKSGEAIVIQQIQENEINIAIKASKMVWADSGWVLFNAARRVFKQGDEVEFASYDTLYAQFLPHTPEVMSYRQKNPRDTGFFELLKLIETKKWMKQDVAKEKVELYFKISFPFSNFIIIILGIPLAANPRRSGGSVGFGLSIIISFIYFILIRAGQSFGYNHTLPPLLSVTIANIVFLVIGVIMFIKTRK